MHECEALQGFPRLKAKSTTSALLITIVGLLSGCTPEAVYTRVQLEDGLAMKAPITSTVRIRIDPTKKVVTWMEDIRDSLGATDRQIRTYGHFPGSTCEIFDTSNWTCEFRAADGAFLEKPEMKDSVLSRFYWTETQKYQRRWYILGRFI